MFKIKICGITNTTDAIAAADAGADAIGLNFYSGSPRCVAIEMAKVIREAVADRVRCVGVFVNDPPDRILSIASQVGIDSVQLHGDEPVTILDELRQIPIVKAFRINGPDLNEVTAFTNAARRMQSTLSAVLLDAYHPKQFGGTGQKLDLADLAQKINCLDGFPWCLAGGLRPDNVARAIQLCQPHAVDTASGVEISPGRKDAEAIRQFVAAARQAFVGLSR